MLSIVNSQASILHVCPREYLRPLRDQVLKVSGYKVDSVGSVTEAFQHFWRNHYNLILIDVEDEKQARDAEKFCSEVKKSQPEQSVAFACNWRVSVHSDCPDDVIRTEFNPEAFVSGVRQILPPS